MQPHKLMLSILLFIFFIVGGLFFLIGDVDKTGDGIFGNYTDISDNAVAFNESRFSKELTSTGSENAMYNISSDMKEDVDGTTSLSTVEYPLSLTGAFKALKGLNNLVSIFGTIVNDVFRILHIPDWAKAFIITAFLITIVFITLYMVFRFQPRSN